MTAPTDVTRSLVLLPRLLIERGNISMADLLEESGYLEHWASVEPAGIEKALASDTPLVQDWLSYSEDKRTSSGWYFHRQDSGFVVGRQVDGAREQGQRYAEEAEACAAFIKLEAESIRNSRQQCSLRVSLPGCAEDMRATVALAAAPKVSNIMAAQALIGIVRRNPVQVRVALRDEIEGVWKEHFSGVRPIPHTVRDELSDRWVRFHHLPESKRYPDTEEEVRTILARHHALMERVFTPEPLVVLAGLYLEPGDRSFTEFNFTDIAGPFEYWTTASWAEDAPPEEELPMSLFVGKCDYERGSEQIIRLVINEDCRDIIFLQPQRPILYHPYDGGVDVIAENSQSRDSLRESFREWLSKHPEGL